MDLPAQDLWGAYHLRMLRQLRKKFSADLLESNDNRGIPYEYYEYSHYDNVSTTIHRKSTKAIISPDAILDNRVRLTKLLLVFNLKSKIKNLKLLPFWYQRWIKSGCSRKLNRN